MTSNDWFEMEKHAPTFHETAINKLDKLSETMEKNIKEGQEDLEK